MNFKFLQMKIHMWTSGIAGFAQKLSHEFRLGKWRCSQGLQEMVYAEYFWKLTFPSLLQKMSVVLGIGLLE